MPAVILLPLMFAVAAPVVAPDFDVDEYPVLNAVLARHQHVDGRVPVLLATTPPGDSSTLAGRAEDEVGDLERTTVESFIAREAMGAQVSPGQGLDPDVLLLPREEERALLLDGDCQAGWARFQEHFPNASGLFETSRVGINHDATQALVSMRWQAGCDSGGAVMHVLEKQQGIWHVVAVVPWSDREAVERTPLPLTDQPDSFVLSRRAPQWVSPRARQGEARRRRIDPRFHESWLIRCARSLELVFTDQWPERLQAPETRRVAAQAAVRFTEEDAQVCREIERYFDLRNKVVGAVVDEAFGRTRPERTWWLARLESDVAAFVAAKREVLEHHAGLFAHVTLYVDELLPVRFSGAVASLEGEVLAGLSAAARRVASEDFLRRYLVFVAAQARDPRSFMLPEAPAPGWWQYRRPDDKSILDAEARVVARQRAARKDALEKAGISSAEASLFERFLVLGEVGPEQPDSAEAWKTYYERLKAQPAAFNATSVTWFEVQYSVILRRIAETNREAELERWWSPNAKPRPGTGAALLVHGAHPDTDDGFAPFSLSLVEPAGKTVWRCEGIAVVEQRLEAPCLRAESVFARKGPHRIVLEAKGRRREFPVVIDHKESAVEVEVDGARGRVTTLRVLPAPAGVSLAASLGERGAIDARLENRTSLTLLPFGDNWTQASRLDVGTAHGWTAARSTLHATPSSSVGPGDSALVAFRRRLVARPLVARAAVRVRLPGHSRGVAFEVHSNDLALGLLSPNEPVETPDCIDPPWPLDLPLTTQFIDVAHVSGSTFLLSSGGVFRVEGERVVPVWSSREPLHRLMSTAGGDLFVLAARSVFRLVDGKTFKRFPTALAEPTLIVDKGEEVMVTERAGRAEKLEIERSYSLNNPALLPELITWVGGSFDGKTGVLVSACHTLAVTTDDGHSWISRPAPTRGAVLLRGDTLYLGGQHGLFRSRDMGLSFDKILDRSCYALSAQGEHVAVACDGDPDMPSGVFVSEAGGAFVSVPGHLTLSARAVSWGEEGELFALESGGLLLRGTRDGLQLLPLNEEGRTRLLELVRPFVPWVEIDENRRPVF